MILAWWGLRRWTRRMKARAVRSASAVTLHVLRMTSWAESGSKRVPYPYGLAYPAAMASPSERLARHPKFSTRKSLLYIN